LDFGLLDLLGGICTDLLCLVFCLLDLLCRLLLNLSSLRSGGIALLLQSGDFRTVFETDSRIFPL
jgi:hypothetical protein